MEGIFENRAKEAKDGEELSIVSDSTTENFNKITMHLLKWIGRIAEFIMEEKGFRLVVEYEPKAEITQISFYEKSEKTENTEEFLAKIKEHFRSEENKKFIDHFRECCRAASHDTSVKVSEKS